LRPGVALGVTGAMLLAVANWNERVTMNCDCRNGDRVMGRTLRRCSRSGKRVYGMVIVMACSNSGMVTLGICRAPSLAVIKRRKESKFDI
jgi:hypothetical protein